MARRGGAGRAWRRWESSLGIAKLPAGTRLDRYACAAAAAQFSLSCCSSPPALDWDYWLLASCYCLA
eukprot:8150226-Lingulodinium_polyedra.AAC.1